MNTKHRGLKLRVCLRAIFYSVMWRNNLRKEKHQLVIKIYLIFDVQISLVSYNANLDPCLNFTLNTLLHSGWHAGISIRNAYFEVSQCWRKRHIHLLFQESTQTEVHWTQVRWTWRAIFETTIPYYLFPEYSPPCIGSLMLFCAQTSRHVGTINSWVEVTTGYQQSRLLCPGEFLNIVIPLTRFCKILGQLACYCKFQTIINRKPHLMSIVVRTCRIFQRTVMGGIPIVHIIPRIACLIREFWVMFWIFRSTIVHQRLFLSF